MKTSLLALPVALLVTACGGGSEPQAADSEPPSAPPTARSLETTEAVPTKAAAAGLPVYRFYNGSRSAHFYTISETERATIQATRPDMVFEGSAFFASSEYTAGLSPVYRLFNTRTGVHFYTISASERSTIRASWPYFTDEGIAYYASTAPGFGLTPLYRFYIPSKGFHFYTASATERDRIQATLAGTYSYEGIGYYVMDSSWVGEKLPNTAVSGAQCFETGSNILVSCAASSARALSQQQDGTRFFYNTEFFSPVGSNPLTNCVQSDLTGLVWEGKTTSGLRAGNNSYTNAGGGGAGDTSGYVAAVNASNLCGFNDWRLPTPQELQNLVLYGVVGPISINLSRLPNTSDASGGYWTSASAPLGGSGRWSVSFGTGARTTATTSTLRHVRLVRGAAFSGARFVFASASYPGDAANNLVIDRQTGLQWRRCVETRTWNGTTCVGSGVTTVRHASAFALAASMPGWRLPNVKELSSLVEPSRASAPLIDTAAFPNTPSTWFWSTTPAVKSASVSEVDAYGVDFVSGQVLAAWRAQLYSARLVRTNP